MSQTIIGAIGGIFTLFIISYVLSQVFTAVDKTMDDTLQNQPALQQTYDTVRTIQDVQGTYEDAKELQKYVYTILIALGISAGIIGFFKLR